MKGQKKKRTNFRISEGTAVTAAYLLSLFACLRQIGLGRIYGPEGAACYAAAFDWFLLPALPLCLGLYEAVSSLMDARLERGRGKDAGRVMAVALGAGILACLIFGGILFAGSGFLTRALSHLPLSALCLRLLLPSLFFLVIFSVLCAGLDGFYSLSASALLRFFFFALLLLAGALLTRPLAGYGEKVGALLQNPQYGPAYGAMGASASVLLAAGVGTLLALTVWIVSRTVRRSRAEFSQSDGREGAGQILVSLLDQSFSTVLVLLFFCLIGLMQSIFYFGAAGEDASGAALLSWGSYVGSVRPLLALPGLLLLSFCAHMLPGLRVGFAQRNQKKFRERCMLSLRCVTLLSMPFAVFSLIMAEPLLQAVLPGGQAEELTGILRLGGVGLVLFGIAAVWGAVLVGMDLLLGLFVGVAAGFVLYLAVLKVLLGTLQMGLYGVACAVLVLSLLLCLIFGFLVSRQGRIRIDWIRVLLAPVVSGAVMAVVCALCGRLLLAKAPAGVNVAVSAVVGFLAYFAAAVALRGATRRELESFPGGEFLLALARTMRLMS